MPCLQADLAVFQQINLPFLTLNKSQNSFPQICPSVTQCRCLMQLLNAGICKANGRKILSPSLTHLSIFVFSQECCLCNLRGGALKKTQNDK